MVSAGVNALGSVSAASGQRGSSGPNVGSNTGSGAEMGIKDSFRDIWGGLHSGTEGSLSGRRPEEARQAEGMHAGRSRSSRPQADRLQDGRLEDDRLEDDRLRGDIIREDKPQAGGQEETAEEMAAAWIRQAAMILQVSAGELQAAMEAMGLEPGDLLREEALAGVVMFLAGEESPLALVTQEKLWGQLEQLKEGLRELEIGGGEPGEALDEDALRSEAGAGKEPVILVTGQENRLTEGSYRRAEQGALSDSREEREELPVQKEAGEGAGRTKENDAFSDPARLQVIYRGEARAEAFVNAARGAGASAGETENIMRQIMDHMRVNLRADSSDLEMQLHPASLGTIRVRLVERGGVIHAQMITENEQVRAALESQLVRLKDAFREQGVRVESVEVNVETREFAEGSFQDRGNSPGKDAGRTRDRGGRSGRIRPGTADGMEQAWATEAMPDQDMRRAGATIELRA